MPGVLAGAAPKISVCTRARSTPRSARAEEIWVMNAAGPHRRGQPPRGLIVTPPHVAGGRAAVADVPVAVGQSGQQGSRLGGERLLGPAPRAVQPPDVAR